MLQPYEPEWPECEVTDTPEFDPCTMDYDSSLPAEMDSWDCSGGMGMDFGMADWGTDCSGWV
jgi:hypothetical protein